MAVAAIYARYSSAGQREESIEDQVRVCTEAAERAGDNVVRVYQDRASTGTSVDHRHGFLQMVADGQRGAFEVLYVYKTDRFARNRYDSAVYKMRLRRAGVRVVSATERIEDGPDGILLESVLEGMAEYYSANLSENVRRGLDGNAEKCRHNGVRTFGYELGADGYFALDEVEAPVVLGCFEAYADGMGMPEICAEYSWVRTKMGKPLTVSMLSRMLRNEKYRGRYSYGGHVVEGGMPRIVSDELFYAVQRMLAAATRRRRGVMDYLLTGKLFDEEGHRYQSQSGHGKSGRKYTYYKCPATGHAVRQDALEAEVARGVAGILEADDDAVAAIVGRAGRGGGGGRGGHGRHALAPRGERARAVAHGRPGGEDGRRGRGGREDGRALGGEGRAGAGPGRDGARLPAAVGRGGGVLGAPRHGAPGPAGGGAPVRHPRGARPRARRDPGGVHVRRRPRRRWRRWRGKAEPPPWRLPWRGFG